MEKAKELVKELSSLGEDFEKLVEKGEKIAFDIYIKEISNAFFASLEEAKRIASKYGLENKLMAALKEGMQKKFYEYCEFISQGYDWVARAEKLIEFFEEKEEARKKLEEARKIGIEKYKELKKLVESNVEKLKK